MHDIGGSNSCKGALWEPLLPSVRPHPSEFFPVAILCDKDIANGTSDTVGGCQNFSLKCIVHNNPIMDQRYLSMNFEVWDGSVLSFPHSAFVQWSSDPPFSATLYF